MTIMQSIQVGVGPVSFADVLAVTRHGAPVVLSEEALASVGKAPRVEDLAAAATPVYGISTGFGALATRHIPTQMRAQLQRSLVRSHAAGSGPEVERRSCGPSCCCASRPWRPVAPAYVARPRS